MCSVSANNHERRRRFRARVYCDKSSSSVSSPLSSEGIGISNTYVDRSGNGGLGRLRRSCLWSSSGGGSGASPFSSLSAGAALPLAGMTSCGPTLPAPGCSRSDGSRGTGMGTPPPPLCRRPPPPGYTSGTERLATRGLFASSAAAATGRRPLLRCTPLHS